MKTIQTKLALLSLVMAVSSLVLYSCKGKVKDSDIQQAIAAKAQTMTGLEKVTTSVKDGVVTLSGETTDETAKVAYESAIKTVPGVEKVSNNIVVVAPPPAPEPVVISPDETLKAAVNDAIKAYSGVKAEVKDGVVTLTGEIRKAELTVLMPTLHALKPKKIENKLTVKK
ncbi:BON domain-containing protein [Pseudoflavitalea sp. X16]|uniref:BON domain-containing protein n=1 Tax=Paraflavitalea devenefica TaxID=2716334 RepID=UPI0014222A80|nr:BON domain-containing protein [Paraflavitalea devenefica]NII27931.1 BON domain-containing protein [Paraflavitalea devenefica]